MEMSGKNSGKKPPLCTGELDTISPPHCGKTGCCAGDSVEVGTWEDGMI
jgi:hypothetical protein